VDCFRGSLNNVAERFLQAAEFYRVEAFMRINGDSPLMNPRYLEQAIGLFMEDQPDLLTNVMPRSFPKGVSIEMLNAEAYARMYPQFSTPDHFEHVTQFFYQNPDSLRIQNFASGGDWGEVRFVVDTAEDFARIEGLLAGLDAPSWTYPLEDLIALYQQGQAE
jgi:spore coat polysaccharide biosynthesis protein SpsF